MKKKQMQQILEDKGFAKYFRREHKLRSEAIFRDVVDKLLLVNSELIRSCRKIKELEAQIKKYEKQLGITNDNNG